MQQPTDDSVLWESFLKGDNQSLEIIYRKYFDELYHYGLKWFKDEQFVEDVIQDLFVKLIRTRENLSTAESVKFYLFRAYRTVAMDKLRKKIRMPFIGEPSDLHFPLELTPESQLITREEYENIREKINKALANLTPRQREALYLKYIEGFSYQQVSKMMKLTSKATYKLMARAIVAIKGQLSEILLLGLTADLIRDNLR